MPELLRTHDIDVVITTRPWNQAAAAATRYGVWRLQPGAEERYRQGPPFFLEARDGNPVSVMSLVVHLPRESQPLAIDSASFATVRDISAGSNRVAPYWGGAEILVDNLQLAHAGGLAAVRARARPFPANGLDRHDPGALELLRWIVPGAARKLMRRLHRQPESTNEWRIAVRRGGDVLREGGSAEMAGFQFLEAPLGHFYADPFPVMHEGTCWLFFEDYAFADRKAALMCAQLTADNRLEDIRVILDRPYHLSYPLVFRHGGTWYLLPESKANGTVDLHVADEFPYRWRFEKTLFRGRAADTAVWIEDDTFWFFTTLVEPEGRGMTLRLYGSDSPAGDWRPHPANPISRDVRNARGAGAIFRRDGRLYRPAQDCSWDYGHGFALNEILTLTADAYEERQVLGAAQDWAPGSAGTHTYNRAGDIEVVDACWPVPRSKHL